jgi:hypothetical protein
LDLPTIDSYPHHFFKDMQHATELPNNKSTNLVQPGNSASGLKLLGNVEFASPHKISLWTINAA